MKKLIITSALCVITNVYAQNTLNESLIPKDSFKQPVSTTANPEVYKLNSNSLNKINSITVSDNVTKSVPITSNNTVNINSSNNANNVTGSSNSSNNSNSGVIINNANNASSDVNNIKNNNINNDSKFLEIQKYSSQSNEEYLKRRNTEFQGSMSQCISKIPRNNKGERNSEELLKCANKK